MIEASETAISSLTAALLAPEVQARFWAKVEKQPNGCWIWIASTLRGYGQFTVRVAGKQAHLYAHRVAWTLETGLPVPDGLYVCHHCDTPLCIRFAHLFTGTQRDNLSDARSKGRLIDGAHCIKVSDAGIQDIRETYQRGNAHILAVRYGVTVATVTRLAKGTGRVVRALDPVQSRTQARTDLNQIQQQREQGV